MWRQALFSPISFFLTLQHSHKVDFWPGIVKNRWLILSFCKNKKNMFVNINTSINTSNNPASCCLFREIHTEFESLGANFTQCKTDNNCHIALSCHHQTQEKRYCTIIDNWLKNVRKHEVTYNAAIPQCNPALSAAAPNTLIPMRAIVGATVRGPMNLNIHPTIPVKPTTTWRHEAVIIAPWICWNSIKHWDNCMFNIPDKRTRFGYQSIRKICHQPTYIIMLLKVSSIGLALAYGGIGCKSDSSGAVFFTHV